MRKKALAGGAKCFHIEAMASPFVPRVPKHVLKTLEVLQSHQGKYFSLDSSSFEIARNSILELKYSYFCLYFAWEGVKKKTLGGVTRCFHMDAMALRFVPKVPKHVLKTLEVLESHPRKYFSLDSSSFEIS